METFLANAKGAASSLPDEILKKINLLKTHRLSDGYILIENLPVEHKVPRTDSNPAQKSSFVSEFCLSLIGSQFGEPYNYIQEENGNLFRNVRPTKANESQQTSDGSKVNLELHTETAFHDLRPDFLLLYCLRSDKHGQAFTLISSLKDILKSLDKETIAELRQSKFKTGIDVSFGNRDKTKFRENLMPVISGPENDPTIIYDLDLMTSETESGKAALINLKEAIETNQKAIYLKPGNLLVFDNRRVIHGRTAYKADYDGYDRWLQRLYISENKEFAESIPTLGRVITTTF